MNVIYPPSPAGRMLFNELDRYEATGAWIAERKFNGTRITLNILNNEVSIFTKHGTVPSLFKLTNEYVNQILALNLKPDLRYILDGELLDHKTVNPAYKNRIVLFDVLQAGEYFYSGPNLLARKELLQEICRNPTELEPNSGIALQASSLIWLSQTFHNDFLSHYQEFLHLPEIEGLILKKSKSTISNFGNSPYEVGWQIRCRKPSKNYQF